MKFGLVSPFADARLTADLAREAESTGWDGFFVAELVWGVDAWVQLAAAAMITSRIRLGTMLTPLPWRDPWKLASETVALDHLSGGRLTLSVGLGAPDAGATAFPLEFDRRLRAERLDEGLAILEGLWRSDGFAFDGKHYRVDPTPFALGTRTEGMPPPPPTLQRPRIPTWVVGVWPRMKSMRRTLRYDGIIPDRIHDDGTHRLVPADVREIAAFVREHRDPAQPFDIVVDGQTEPGDSSKVAEWAEAGATWWTESRWMFPNTAAGIAAFRERLTAGPPGLS